VQDIARGAIAIKNLAASHQAEITKSRLLARVGIEPKTSRVVRDFPHRARPPSDAKVR